MRRNEWKKKRKVISMKLLEISLESSETLNELSCWRWGKTWIFKHSVIRKGRAGTSKEIKWMLFEFLMETFCWVELFRVCESRSQHFSANFYCNRILVNQEYASEYEQKRIQILLNSPNRIYFENSFWKVNSNCSESWEW